MAEPLFARPLVGMPANAARALPDPDDAGRGGPLELRVSDDDFVVDEVPQYLESGEGEHLYLHLRKRGISTPDLVRRLCRQFKLREMEVGIAGRKDARGVTSQRISVPARKVLGREHEVAELGDVELLSAKRHGNKLRLGHLAGNRFTIRVAGDVDVTALSDRARMSAEVGFANYFGAQRFGPGDASLREAERFLERGPRPRPARSRKEKFLVSIVQSALFNAWLHERIVAGAYHRAIDGDVMLKAGNLAPFTSSEPDVDTPRVEAQEVFVSGPLWGSEMRRPDREALTRESRSLAEQGVSESALLSHPAFQVGARRPSRVVPLDVVVLPDDGGAKLSFTLPPGSYATVFLREICGPRLSDRAERIGGADPFAA